MDSVQKPDSISVRRHVIKWKTIPKNQCTSSPVPVNHCDGPVSHEAAGLQKRGALAALCRRCRGTALKTLTLTNSQVILVKLLSAHSFKCFLQATWSGCRGYDGLLAGCTPVTQTYMNQSRWLRGVVTRPAGTAAPAAGRAELTKFRTDCRGGRRPDMCSAGPFDPL